MTKQAAAYEEYSFYAEHAWRAERAGRHSDAEHYRAMAQDAVAQLRREERTNGRVH
jgi:hypothetical protein